MRSLNVFGPPGSGKSANAHKIMDFFGLFSCADEPNLKKFADISEGWLILSQSPSSLCAQRLHIDTVLQLLRSHPNANG